MLSLAPLSYPNDCRKMYIIEYLDILDSMECIMWLVNSIVIEMMESYLITRNSEHEWCCHNIEDHGLLISCKWNPRNIKHPTTCYKNCVQILSYFARLS